MMVATGGARRGACGLSVNGARWQVGRGWGSARGKWGVRCARIGRRATVQIGTYVQQDAAWKTVRVCTSRGSRILPRQLTLSIVWHACAWPACGYIRPVQTGRLFLTFVRNAEYERECSGVGQSLMSTSWPSTRGTSECSGVGQQLARSLRGAEERNQHAHFTQTGTQLMLHIVL